MLELLIVFILKTHTSKAISTFLKSSWMTEPLVFIFIQQRHKGNRNWTYIRASWRTNLQDCHRKYPWTHFSRCFCTRPWLYNDFSGVLRFTMLRRMTGQDARHGWQKVPGPFVPAVLFHSQRWLLCRWFVQPLSHTSICLVDTRQSLSDDLNPNISDTFLGSLWLRECADCRYYLYSVSIFNGANSIDL